MPLVVRSAVGGGGRFGAIHSQIPISWFQGVPGLKIVAPVDAGRRQGAAQGGDPRRQPGALLRAQAPVRDQGRGATATDAARSARPRSCRAGADVTLVVGDEAACTTAWRRPRRSPPTASTPRSIDLRTLRPLDVATVLRSVAKTNRLRRRRGGPAHRRLGRRGARRRRRGGAAATSTTPGASRRPTTRSPTARRSRTRSSRTRRRSRRRVRERLGAAQSASG